MFFCEFWGISNNIFSYGTPPVNTFGIPQMNSRSTVKRSAKEKYQLIEKKLHEGFLELFEKGTSLKRWWFTLREHKILNDFYPEIELKFSLFLTRR